MVLEGMPDTFKLLSLEFFINPQCHPGAVLAKAATVDVYSGEEMIVSEREVPFTVLEVDISEVGENLSAAEVGLGNEPDSSARLTGESEDILPLLIEPCSYTHVLYPRFLLFYNQAP